MAANNLLLSPPVSDKDDFFSLVKVDKETLTPGERDIIKSDLQNALKYLYDNGLVCSGVLDGDRVFIRKVSLLSI